MGTIHHPRAPRGLPGLPGRDGRQTAEEGGTNWWEREKHGGEMIGKIHGENHGENHLQLMEAFLIGNPRNDFNHDFNHDFNEIPWWFTYVPLRNVLSTRIRKCSMNFSLEGRTKWCHNRRCRKPVDHLQCWPLQIQLIYIYIYVHYIYIYNYIIWFIHPI